MKDALAERGIDVTKEMVYQTVFGNIRHPEITRQLIDLVKGYKQSQKELNREITEVIGE